MLDTPSTFPILQLLVYKVLSTELYRFVFSNLVISLPPSANKTEHLKHKGDFITHPAPLCKEFLAKSGGKVHVEGT